MSRNRVVTAALVTALVGVLAFGGIQISRLHGDLEARQERTQILRAVRTEVVALTNISATTTDKQLGVFLDGMTKRLKSEFAPQAGTLRNAMVKNKVQSRGRIVAIGLTASGAKRASAIVAAEARVSNARTKGDQERSYRLSLTLQKVGGRWLVDSMEFVQ